MTKLTKAAAAMRSPEVEFSMCMDQDPINYIARASRYIKPVIMDPRLANMSFVVMFDLCVSLTHFSPLLQNCLNALHVL
jgi:hypothetical protein